MGSRRIFLGLAIVVIFLLAPGAVWAQPQEPYPIGTLTLEAKQVAAGIGYTWGGGTFRFQGKEYPFSIKGLEVAAVGVSKVSAVGDVYNLKNVADFPGKYLAMEAGAAIIKGPAGLLMRNDKGVVINMRATQEGVQLTLGAEGFSITMK